MGYKDEFKKHILITGASSGFGKELALIYAKNWDCELYLLARRGEKLQDLKQEIKRINPNIDVHIGVGDINQRSFVKKFCKDLAIDILVNNAGLARGIKPAYECNFDDWEEMIETNIKALSYITYTLLPKMVQKGSGHIINVGSIAGTYPYMGGNVYGASKAFVRQFSRNLRADLFDKNIRVSNIEPGLCDGSDFSLTRYYGDEARARAVYADTTPLHAIDVANAIFWVSAQSPHININHLELMPTTQASAGLVVHKV